MNSKNHTHKYRRAVGRITDGNRDSKLINYYKCTLPDCSHYTRADLILGKRSICNKCDKEFILPLATRALTNIPHCKDCTRSKMPRAKKTFEFGRKTVMESVLDEMEIVDE